MDLNDLALMCAVLGGACVLATLLAWRGRESRADIAFLAGSGAVMGASAGLLYVL